MLQLPLYRSHKTVRAAPMIGWRIDPDHVLVQTANGDVVASPKLFARGEGDLGDYLVVYDDGYVSWSPKRVFEEGYTPVAAGVGLTFGQALQRLKQGDRVARVGWNGKGMWLALTPGQAAVPAEKFWSPHNRAFAWASGGAAPVLPTITMKTASGEILMGWVASQADMLADDWMVVT